MKTYYQPSTLPFAIAGVQAISMSDEHYGQLKGKATFLDENSKEVLAYKAELAKREAEQDVAAIAAQDVADEREALDELLKAKFGGDLTKRVAEKRAARGEGKKAKK